MKHVTIEDIHQFVEELEKIGELKRITVEVDTNLEIAEILRRVGYTKGPALLFENVKGHDCLLYTSPSPRA